jgi:hypothetical protein
MRQQRGYHIAEGKKNFLKSHKFIITIKIT